MTNFEIIWLTYDGQEGDRTYVEQDTKAMAVATAASLIQSNQASGFLVAEVGQMPDRKLVLKA